MPLKQSNKDNSVQTRRKRAHEVCIAANLPIFGESLICNQRVGGSSPSASSTHFKILKAFQINRWVVLRAVLVKKRVRI